MELAVVITIGLVLGWISLQDFLERRVSLMALLALFVLCVLNSCLASQTSELPARVAFNSLFAGLILVSGTLVVKFRRPGDAFASFIGAGDILFLIAISPMFSFGSYLVFLNTSIILILLGFGIVILCKWIKKVNSIPLAGALAICMIMFISVNEFTRYNVLEEYDWLYILLG